MKIQSGISTETKIEKYGSNNGFNLLVTAPIHFLPELKSQIINQSNCIFAFKAEREIVIDLIKDMDAWMCSPCPTYHIDENILKYAEKLKILATPSTGSNHIDKVYAKSKGIKIFTLKGTNVVENIFASSEFTFNLMIATIRKFPQAYMAVRTGIWRESEDLFRGRELNGMTLGIIGYGRIGRNMARYSTAFGMKILAYDPYIQINDAEVTQMNSLDAMLSKSDVVAVCVHLNENTYKMVNDELFEKMRNGVYFINTSRGDVVDEDSLIKHLETGKIQAAGLDVISGEITEDKYTHPLVQYARNHENLIITPHIAGLTYDSENKAQNAAYEAIKNYFHQQ